MLVQSMTFAESYRELDRDRENLARWWKTQVDRLRRQMIKRDRTAFPVGYSYDYTTPRHIRYLVNAFIGDKRLKSFLTVCVALQGKTVYMTWFYDDNEVRPMVMLPHMWQRYAERMQFDEDHKNLVHKFFLRNFCGCGTRNQKVVSRSVRYNGEDHLAFCVDDGVLLGRMEGDIFIVKTFITYEMSCGRQEEEFTRLQQAIYSPGLKVHPYYRYLPTPDIMPVPKKLIEKLHKKTEL